MSSSPTSGCPAWTAWKWPNRSRPASPGRRSCIVTGYGSAANEERARAAGVTDFLHKPLSPEMIEDSAANALRQASVPPVAIPRSGGRGTRAGPRARGRRGAERGSMLKNMALFLSAPFIGLLYAVLLPFVGLGMLGWFAAQALLEKAKDRDLVRFGAFALRLLAGPVHRPGLPDRASVCRHGDAGLDRLQVAGARARRMRITRIITRNFRARRGRHDTLPQYR